MGVSETNNFTENSTEKSSISFLDFKKEVLEDYYLAQVSREVSFVGRKEVLTGKAKFGIFGDGKELPQIAMAKAFKNGDFRAGYYRDQTFALATGMISVRQLFAQLYANPGLESEPHSAGRQMNNHFATRSLTADGQWKTLTAQKNTAADNSPTASQMIRSLGLALASKKYRALQNIISDERFSINGNEVCFVTIGDASTSEGLFWEVINAAGVQRVPLAVNVWDDGYGISVPKELQTTKGSISTILEGFRVDEKGRGYQIYVLKGWDYPSLVKTYKDAIEQMRITHIPAIFHIEELTQPQGHSTSGSHERYKSAERLQFEKDFDGIVKMRHWMLEKGIASEEEILSLEETAKKYVAEERKAAWTDYHQVILDEMQEVIDLMTALAAISAHKEEIIAIVNDLKSTLDPVRKDIFKAIHAVLMATAYEPSPARTALLAWKNEQFRANDERYNSYLHTGSALSPLRILPVPVEYPEKPKYLSGFQVLNACFDANLARDPKILAFGEDVGKIGDVNQAFNGMQAKYGSDRVYDTGIREASIMGEGIGLAMRGFRPIAEIQYLDYLLYGLQPLSDDLSCLSYRTKGGQKAPLIIRTRGHRLEGIWHTGSPISMLLGAIRGIHVCVPRNMTQAAGFYNLLLRGDEPALVIECLNGYRLKEKIPSNPGDFMVPLGVPEVLIQGTDLTLVTYGSCVRIAEEAVKQLSKMDIKVELIDVQTLLPFDLKGIIGQSVKKTNRVVFLDEDVPGGASAYMLQQVLEHQQIFNFLDTEPLCISARHNRSAFGSDGDYFCKPSAEDVFKTIYNIMHQAAPVKFPNVF
jgi:pyruvate/2-oxoglutarate/acetoin dehydrogenase E1 component/TPP-dependent pyruvate/acetoin dehydrogenase alpha subunit